MAARLAHTEHAKATADGDPQRLRQHIDRARRLTLGGLLETRRAIGALRGETPPLPGGLTNSQIAQTLVISESTVKTHINHLFAKTGISSRAHAVSYAYQHHLATPPAP